MEILGKTIQLEIIFGGLNLWNFWINKYLRHIDLILDDEDLYVMDFVRYNGQWFMVFVVVDYSGLEKILCQNIWLPMEVDTALPPEEWRNKIEVLLEDDIKRMIEEAVLDLDKALHNGKLPISSNSIVMHLLEG